MHRRGEEGEQWSDSIFATEWMNLWWSTHVVPEVMHVACLHGLVKPHTLHRFDTLRSNENDCMVQNVERLPVCAVQQSLVTILPD